MAYNPRAKILTQFPGALNVQETTTPGTPPSSGYNYLYFKSDNNLYGMNSVGTETQLSYTGGSANTFLSNLSSPTSINQPLLFAGNGEVGLGSGSDSFSMKYFGTYLSIGEINSRSTEPQNTALVNIRPFSAGTVAFAVWANPDTTGADSFQIIQDGSDHIFIKLNQAGVTVFEVDGNGVFTIGGSGAINNHALNGSLQIQNSGTYGATLGLNYTGVSGVNYAWRSTGSGDVDGPGYLKLYNLTSNTELLRMSPAGVLQLPLFTTPGYLRNDASGNLSSSGLTTPTITRLTSAGTTAGYAFNVSSANATVGATYTNNGNTYTVVTTISAGTQLFVSGAAVPTGSGTLTKTSGTGDATITFSSNFPTAAYTTPANVTYLEIDMVGAGGGGGGSGNASGSTGQTGGASTFGSNILLANGGAGGAGGGLGGGGAGGTVSIITSATVIAVIAVSGGNGTEGVFSPAADICGGNGGVGPWGGGGAALTAAAGGNASTNSGSGGGGGSIGAASGTTGSGGGAGGYLKALILSPATTYYYAIGVGGTGGAAGTSGLAGGNGANGPIIIKEYYN